VKTTPSAQRTDTDLHVLTNLIYTVKSTCPNRVSYVPDLVETRDLYSKIERASPPVTRTNYGALGQRGLPPGGVKGGKHGKCTSIYSPGIPLLYHVPDLLGGSPFQDRLGASSALVKLVFGGLR
jgi:hypothetical protein